MKSIHNTQAYTIWAYWFSSVMIT